MVIAERRDRARMVGRVIPFDFEQKLIQPPAFPAIFIEKFFRFYCIQTLNLGSGHLWRWCSKQPAIWIDTIPAAKTFAKRYDAFMSKCGNSKGNDYRSPIRLILRCQI